MFVPVVRPARPPWPVIVVCGLVGVACLTLFGTAAGITQGGGIASNNCGDVPRSDQARLDKCVADAEAEYAPTLAAGAAVAAVAFLLAVVLALVSPACRTTLLFVSLPFAVGGAVLNAAWFYSL